MNEQTEAEKRKARIRAFDISLIAIGILLALAVVFQLFLRFSYVHTGGMKVVRIDRLSGESCTVPCTDSGNYGPQYASDPYVPAPTPTPAKVCHEANVVRVSRSLRLPVQRTPTPYREGGFRRAPGHARTMHAVDDAVELSDGHVYAFAPGVFASDVTTWSTGEDVEVCATWSKLEQRPYYSVGSSDSSTAAMLAL